MACSLLLFANSGVYHISNGHFPAKVSQLLRRIDHANIYLLIAGTYTPLALALMTPDHQRLVLGIIWTGAVIGMVANVCWITAPRWLFTILYVVLGWVAVWFIPELYRAGGAAIVVLIAAGGVIYTLGAVVYALKNPILCRTGLGFTRFSMPALWPPGCASVSPATWPYWAKLGF